MIFVRKAPCPLCIYVNTLDVPICLSRIICSDLRKVYTRKERKTAIHLSSDNNAVILLHFHLVRCWSRRCKNFISFYNRSRINLSSWERDNMSQHSLFQQFSPFYLRSEELQMRKGLGLPASVSSFQKIFPFWLSCCPSIILFVFVLRKTIWSSKERKHKVETFEQSAKHFTTNNHFSDKIKDQMLMFYFKHCQRHYGPRR